MSDIYPVSLHVYDLSGNMAQKFSRQLIGTQINGIWYTGIVVHGREYYYGGGISYDLPGKTPFGKCLPSLDLYLIVLTKLLLWSYRSADKDNEFGGDAGTRGYLHGAAQRHL